MPRPTSSTATRARTSSSASRAATRSTAAREDDDLTGGHNVVGGLDAGDRIDGGAGNDVVLGDNGTILRTGSALSVRFRELARCDHRQRRDASTAQLNPTGVEARQISVFDHPGAAGTSGDDYIAGGPDDDVIFGQMGNDTIQGDGDIDIVNAPSPCAGVGTGVGACRTGTALHVNASRDRASDGDDYIEGNGGNDVIFGNQGQDDIIGGNSDLFGLDLATERPDGEDLIFGGSGTRTALDDPGDVSTTGHARDADVILGDNGAIFRLIGSDGQFLTFNYDSYGPLEGDPAGRRAARLQPARRPPVHLDRPERPGGVDCHERREHQHRRAATSCTARPATTSSTARPAATGSAARARTTTCTASRATTGSRAARATTASWATTACCSRAATGPPSRYTGSPRRRRRR